MAVTVVNITDSLDQWRSKTNTISTNLGDTATITTTATNVVGGLNELDNEQGDLTQLTTAQKSSLVGSMNEIKSDFDALSGSSALTRPVLIAFA
tara:strand:- start:6804 stop:7085 length:282 start_codon:yes stop_codon:yes gene_type:complete